jgi:hypothetical protein
MGNVRTSDLGQLASTGSGIIRSSASLGDWPRSGFCHVRDAAGATREVVYYSARTDDILSILSQSRALLGTSASAGSSTDTIEPVPGLRFAIESPATQPDGLFQTIPSQTVAPSSVAWSLASGETNARAVGDLQPGEMMGLWLHRHIPPGAVAAPDVMQKIFRRFDAV